MKVFIIGSGTMSTGITQVLMSSPDIEMVYVLSRSTEKAKALVQRCLSKLERLVQKEKITLEDFELAAKRVAVVDNYHELPNCALVIEAVAEDYEVKRTIFESIDKHVAKDTIIASNTSSLSITELASHVSVPENVIGLHFFNPAPVMELVEIIAGALTADKTRDKVYKLVEQLGKRPVIVEEAPGFIVNRMLIPMINEAVTILAEGVALKEDIDTAMMYGAHHPMGPLKLSDLIGNDVVLSIMDVIYKETGDSKYRAHPLLRKMVRAGLMGQKTNNGFYEYNNA
jgi:3-hydroxybutyryl-CoA dehydrogenase